MSGLINPSLLKSNLLIDTIKNSNIEKPIIKYNYIIINYLIPLIFFILFCFYLKHRYNQKNNKPIIQKQNNKPIIKKQNNKTIIKKQNANN
jgi:hypothetical protein